MHAGEGLGLGDYAHAWWTGGIHRLGVAVGRRRPGTHERLAAYGAPARDPPRGRRLLLRLGRDSQQPTPRPGAADRGDAEVPLRDRQLPCSCSWRRQIIHFNTP